MPSIPAKQKRISVEEGELPEVHSSDEPEKEAADNLTEPSKAVLPGEPEPGDPGRQQHDRDGEDILRLLHWLEQPGHTWRKGTKHS